VEQYNIELKVNCRLALDIIHISTETKTKNNQTNNEVMIVIIIITVIAYYKKLR
jgi:hypothetical protein